ncbi:DUF459 domain-containing protein [Pseudomonas ovata]|uniref:SGNH/GDSL hydrolase family protein n=1 Tax=Pseudomonas ovata TaxID=1839709 RepID=UPI000D69193A|nr:SGNH family hydrolase [Pseudomonas ovata]
MPVSDTATAGRSLFIALKTLMMLLVVIGILSWLNQDSMRLYCQQKYHSGCELPGLGELPAWRLGADITRSLGQGREAFVAALSGHEAAPGTAQDEAVEPAVPGVPVVELPPSVAAVTVIAGTRDAPGFVAPADSAALPGATPEPARPKPVEPAAVAAPVPASIPGPGAPAVALSPAPVVPVTPHRRRPPGAPHVVLEPGDEVFFVGDSLMQGVAPHLANSLLKRYNIKSINLSKQSTGLAYPGFFNWPQTVHETLEAHRNIRLMVIFLGPNDPWDMPESRGKPFLRFKSEAWEALYRQRVRSILEQAQQFDAQVIWVGPPNMNAAKLSTGMQYLRELYRTEAQQYQQIYLSANEVFGYQAEDFSFYMTDEAGKKSKIRVDDGIHFTPFGQKLIANKVLTLIDVHQPGLSER